jgi:hypothetical protein
VSAFAATLALLAAGTARAASPPAPLAAPADEAVEVAATRYRAGWLHQLLFGKDYRALWALPVQVEVLDLARFAGGLAPVRRVGAGQSSGLALAGADGRAYTFRGVEKDATRGLSPELQRTVAGRIAQDQVAAMLPGAPVVAVALLDAAEVLHVEPRLVVMPDDARLGAFREDFANVLGTIEEYPRAAEGGRPGFAGATELVDTEELFERLRTTPGERVDSRAFLRARLVDLVLGDWDRHAGQWRWAKRPGDTEWQPIPEDRDFAFCRFEGLVLAIARNWSPRWVSFGDEYPYVLGLTWQAWPLDRTLLSDLEWPAWDEAADELRRLLTDEAIDAALARLPEAYRREEGARLERSLRRRRDALPEAARAFYALLAEEVPVEATDAAEVAELVATEGGDLEVTVRRVGAGGAADGAPFFRRRFNAHETAEVRLDLRGGADRLVTRGRSRIRVRVLGGEGDDRFDDSRGGGARVADWEGRNRLVPGRGTRLDTRPYSPPPPESEKPWLPARDWGRQATWLPWFGASPEIGLFLGAGIRVDRYGFRTFPFAWRQLLRAGWATGPGGLRVDYEGELRRENSGTFLTLSARYSELEILRFFGPGNETPAPQSETFFEARQTRVSIAPAVHVPLTPRLLLGLGPTIQHATTERPRNRYIGQVRPYGSEPFGQIGVGADLVLDTRDLAVAPSRGVLLSAGGSFHPAAWDVREPFGELHAEAAGVFRASLPLRPTLALRARAEHVFGLYPFHEAAYVGGPFSVRGFSLQRFAGDAGAFGNAELRLRLGTYDVVLPGAYGLFALADAGRVWVDGESSRRWHAGFGGGLWFAYLDPNNTVTITIARSDERTSYYLRMGFMF